MIPYEDLVIALQSWRAKQGLPVGQLSGTFAPPPVVARPAAPPPPPARPSPPAAPPARAATPPMPPPLDDLELEEHPIDESHYENEGGDFAMSFDAAAAAAKHAAQHTEAEDESTSIGTPPPRPSDGGFGVATDPNPLAALEPVDTEELPDPDNSIRTHNRNDDW